MPSITKKGRVELEAENAAISSRIADEPRPDDEKLRRHAVLKRSAYSETEVHTRLETGKGETNENDGLVKHYSESNIHIQKLTVLYDDLKSETCSSSSGLAIIPFVDGRGVASVASGKDLVPSHDEIAIEDNVEKQKIDFEGKDTVIALPEGWPQFQNRPWRRRSCELVKNTSSCIRKAVSHLHQLQDLLDAIHKGDGSYDGRFRKQRSSATSDLEIKAMDEAQYQASVLENRSLTDESGTQISSASSHDRRIRWLLSSASLANIDEEPDSGEPRLESSASGATLEVRGRSAVTFRSVMSSTKPGSAASLNVCQGDDVIDEVITLLGRMESDRISTLDALVKERERVRLLRSEIDTQAYKRMHDLPLAVQREHEACAIDINELRWHCAYRGRIETRIKERVHQAEVRHAKVLQDLSNIQKHCPLVEEKLDLEGEAMSSIQLKQDETDDELSDTIQRLRATETKTAEAQGRAAQERSLIKQDVAVVRNELNAVSDELAQLRMYFTSNTHTMNDIRNTLKENAQQLVVLEEREERIKALEASQQDKVQSLRDKIVEQEAEHIKLVEENNKLRNEKQIAEVSMESNNTKLEHQIKNASKKVRGLTSKNKESMLEITDFNKKLEKCAKQKISDEKAVKRALQEMEKVKEQTEVSKDETRKVQVLHNNLTETLVTKREDVSSVEESLKTTAEALKKQVKDEAHARTVLQARIASDAQDFSKTQVDSKKKREKATQRAEEIEKLVTNVREQVSKLEKIHSERLETIAQLDKILEKVALQHSEMEARFRSEITDLQPKEEELKKETLDLSKRLDHITWKSEMMEKKMVDMESSTQMMNKVIRNTQQSYNDLNEEMTELRIQIETGSGTQQDLKKSLQQLEERINTGESNHKAHMADRSLVLTTNQSGVRTALEENQKLALTYHRLHNTFINNKAALMRLLEKRVNNEDSVKDHRQLYVLQGRMREALEYFYRLRGLQSKADIAEFELKCVANGEKLVTLRSEMMRVVEHINRFLEANNASHDVISVEAAKLAQTPPSGALYA